MTDDTKRGATGEELGKTAGGSGPGAAGGEHAEWSGAVQPGELVVKWAAVGTGVFVTSAGSGGFRPYETDHALELAYRIIAGIASHEESARFVKMYSEYLPDDPNRRGVGVILERFARLAACHFAAIGCRRL